MIGLLSMTRIEESGANERISCASDVRTSKFSISTINKISTASEVSSKRLIFGLLVRSETISVTESRLSPLETGYETVK